VNGAARLGAATVVAALAAGVPMFPLTEDRTFLLLAMVLVGLSATIGALLRRAGATEGLVRLAQLAPVALVPWLVPEARDPLRLYVETTGFVQVAFAPMPFQIGFALFSAVLIWVLYLLLETLAIGLASPGWTFPVLVLPYLIPTLGIFSESSPLLFVFPAAAYALLLATATRNALGTPSGVHQATAAGWRRGVLTTAILSTVLALTGAMLFSLPISERSNASSGGGSGAVQLGDPSIDLIRNINAPSDRTVITYRSSDDAGQYLRLAALPVFDASGFHLTATDLIPLQFDGDLPRAVSNGTVRTSIQIGQLDGQYLPMPWFPLTAQVAGDNWRYDPKTLAVVAIGTGRETATRNLTYQTTSARLPAVDELLPTLEEAGDPGDGGLTRQLPPELSPAVRQLALDLTARSGVDSAGDRAKALLDYLHSSAFQYSTAVSPGTTLGTLDDFLLGSRIGYCEQFAGSMAVLARVVGIPSRVVVGFLPGRRAGDHWEVSTRNMHAWTELYFGDGVGWVPVDPTPGGAVAGGPQSASPSPSSRSATPTASAATPTQSAAAPLPTPVDPGAGSTDPLPWVGAAVILGLAGAGPRLTRAGLRLLRLQRGSDPRRAGEGAWAEVRAVARDRGQAWPTGTTRQVAAELGPHLDQQGQSALNELAIVVERARYDREPEHDDRLRQRVEEVTGAIERRWASPTAGIWWPRSLWPRTLLR
jgi:transglutaminase-like putative cysteine protease